MTDLLIIFVLFLAALACGWFGHQWSLRHRPMADVRAGLKVCDVCGAPAARLRTHAGHYRCPTHKGAA